MEVSIVRDEEMKFHPFKLVIAVKELEDLIQVKNFMDRAIDDEDNDSESLCDTLDEIDNIITNEYRKYDIPKAKKKR